MVWLKPQISWLQFTVSIYLRVPERWNSPVPFSLTHTEHFHSPDPLTTDQSCSNCCLCVLFPSVSVLFSAQCQKASLLTILWIVEPVVAQIKQCSTFTFSLCVCVCVKSETRRTGLSFYRHLSFKVSSSIRHTLASPIVSRVKTPRTGNKMTSVRAECADCSSRLEAQVLTFVSVC